MFEDQRKDSPRAIAFCPHCGNRAPQRLIGVHSNLSGPVADYYTLVACETCDKGLLYRSGPNPHAMAAMYGPFTLDDRELVWPKTDPLHRSVPPTVHECYAEARAVKRLAPNAFANQIRRALEALCHDRGAGGRVLSDNLKLLADRGEIPPTLAEMSEVLRMLGNVGSHAGEQKVAPQFVEAIDEFFNAIVEYVYVAPYRVQELREEIDRARSAI